MGQKYHERCENVFQASCPAFQLPFLSFFFLDNSFEIVNSRWYMSTLDFLQIWKILGTWLQKPIFYYHLPLLDVWIGQHPGKIFDSIQWNGKNIFLPPNSPSSEQPVPLIYYYMTLGLETQELETSTLLLLPTLLWDTERVTLRGSPATVATVRLESRCQSLEILDGVPFWLPWYLLASELGVWITEWLSFLWPLKVT